MTGPPSVHFAGVARRGGHSTYRVMLEDANDPATQERYREVIVLGCGHERAAPRFNAIDVPPDVDGIEVSPVNAIVGVRLHRGLCAIPRLRTRRPARTGCPRSPGKRPTDRRGG